MNPHRHIVIPIHNPRTDTSSIHPSPLPSFLRPSLFFLIIEQETRGRRRSRIERSTIHGRKGWTRATRQSLGPMLREQSRPPALGVRFLVARYLGDGNAIAAERKLTSKQGGWWWCRPTLSAVSPVPLGFEGRRGPPLVRLGVENTIDADLGGSPRREEMDLGGGDGEISTGDVARDK